MKILRTMMVFAFVVGILLMGTSAHAGFILRMTDDINNVTVTVSDGSILDVNPVVGAITFVGAVGAWNINNVTTGVSKPILPGEAIMDLNSVNISGASGGKLILELTDTDFSLNSTATTYNMKSDIGGTLGGTSPATLLMQKYYDVDNKEFGGVLVHSLEFTSPPIAFSGSVSSPVQASPNFSITDVITITHTRAGSTSFDAQNLVAIPEPGTLMLLGSGLLGIAGYARVKFGRKKKEA